jgi:hypothetical protein
VKGERMNVDFAFICDYADAREKINAIGIGFDRIITQILPVRYPHFSIVVQLRFSRDETGLKDVHVQITDADGKDIIPPINSQIAFIEPPAGILNGTTRLVMEFNNVEFKNPGDYSVNVNVASREVASIPITIAQPPHVNN